MNKTGKLAIMLGIIAMISLGGCTSNSPYQFKESGELDNIHKVEEANDAKIIAIEFDDQGRFYDRRQFDNLKKTLKEYDDAGNGVSLAVFVHGWRHNGNTNDRDYKRSKQILAEMEKLEGNRDPRKVVGVYIGWRGKSATLDIAGVDIPAVFSFWDRKNTAERVATGQVREVFAFLSKFKENVNAKQKEKEAKEKKRIFTKLEFAQEKRVRMIIVGHSFGGLIAYQSVSESLIREVVSCGMDKESTKLDSEVADMVVVINAAFEGARYEPLHKATIDLIDNKDKKTCDYSQAPIFMSITADNDAATGYAFPVGRWFSNSMENTSPKPSGNSASKDIIQDYKNLQDQEGEALLKTIGHIERYRMFDLCLVGKTKDESCETLIKKPTNNAKQDRLMSKDIKYDIMDIASDSKETEEQKKERKKIREEKLLSLAVHKHEPDSRHGETWEIDDQGSPIWVVMTHNSEIIDGHSELMTDSLISFIVRIYGKQMAPK